VHVVAVHYAQHRHVVSYPWPKLEELWAELPAAGEHPLVFVAADSHASYPRRCRSGCGLESGYDGRLPWGNNGATCAGACLKPLPVGEDGGAALWNAFPGHWGNQTCILLGAYCEQATAPRSPSFQGRYRHPDRARRA
jgi:hypothetical protein